MQMRHKAARNSDNLLTESCTYSQAITLVSYGGTTARKVPETYRKRLSCGFRVRAIGIAIIIPELSPFPELPTGGRHLTCVEPSPKYDQI